ncbi:hypothetical protein EST62_13300 [Chlorobaculum sp. 24CR]|nr:hypothetical protein EST62_13300 [Chlorobaculum sp. 24CR]
MMLVSSQVQVSGPPAPSSALPVFDRIDDSDQVGSVNRVKEICAVAKKIHGQKTHHPLYVNRDVAFF